MNKKMHDRRSGVILGSGLGLLRARDNERKSSLLIFSVRTLVAHLLAGVSKNMMPTHNSPFVRKTF